MAGESFASPAGFDGKESRRENQTELEEEQTASGNGWCGKKRAATDHEILPARKQRKL